MIDLTPILQALIGLLAALVTYKLIPWIKARTTVAQQEQLETGVRIAVFAAEQLFGAGHGAEKFDYAIHWLADHGYQVDKGTIEAAVYNYLSHDDKPPDTAEEQKDE